MTDAILALVRREFAVTAPLRADTPLLSSGLVDSLGLAQLLDALEERFGASVDVSDVGTDNFDTAEQIAAFLAARPCAPTPR